MKLNKNQILFFGFLGGIIAGLAFLVGHLSNLKNPSSSSLSVSLGFTFIIFSTVPIFFGLRKIKQIAHPIKLSFGTYFLNGSLMALLASVVYAFSWQIYVRAHTDVYYIMLKKYNDEINSNNLKPKALQLKKDENAKMVNIYRNPIYAILLSMFLEYLPLVLVFTAVYSYIIYTKQPKILNAGAG